jgi:hypothetical protein
MENNGEEYPEHPDLVSMKARKKAEERLSVIMEELEQAKAKLKREHPNIRKDPRNSKPMVDKVKYILQELRENFGQRGLEQAFKDSRDGKTLQLLESGCSNKVVTRWLTGQLGEFGYLPGNSKLSDNWTQLKIKLAIGESVHIMKDDIEWDRSNGSIISDYYFNPKYTSLNPEILTLTCKWPEKSLDPENGIRPKGISADVEDIGRIHRMGSF